MAGETTNPDASTDRPKCIVIGGAPGSYGGQILSKIYSQIKDRPIAVIDNRDKAGVDPFEKFNQAIKDGKNIVYLTENPDVPYHVLGKKNYSIETCIMATHPTISFASELIEHDRLIERDPSADATLLSYSQHDTINADWIRSAEKLERLFRVDKLRVLHKDGTEIYANERIPGRDPKRGWVKALGAVEAMLQGRMANPTEAEERLLQKCHLSNSAKLSDKSAFTHSLVQRYQSLGRKIFEAIQEASTEIRDRVAIRDDIAQKNTHRSFDYPSNEPAHNDEIFSHCEQWIEALKKHATDIKRLTLPEVCSKDYNVTADPDKHFTYLDRAVAKLADRAMVQAGDRRIAFDRAISQLRTISEQAREMRLNETRESLPSAAAAELASHNAAAARGLHERSSRSR